MSFQVHWTFLSWNNYTSLFLQLAFTDSWFQSHILISNNKFVSEIGLNASLSLSLFLSPCCQWVVGENGVLKPKRVNPNVYQPPSLKGRCEECWCHRWPSCAVIPPPVRALCVYRASLQSNRLLAFLTKEKKTIARGWWVDVHKKPRLLHAHLWYGKACLDYTTV